ncbi:hypothetical protein HDV05_003371 [Chytridiales sp. JEL 0842]|nr:hypothetical protein HDV05_003371 [Chytridiales sp. JEL 0842]
MTVSRQVQPHLPSEDPNAFVSVKGVGITTRPNTTVHPLTSSVPLVNDSSNTTKNSKHERSKGHLFSDDPSIEFGQSLQGFDTNCGNEGYGGSGVPKSRVSKGVDRWWKEKERGLLADSLLDNGRGLTRTPGQISDERVSLREGGSKDFKSASTSFSQPDPLKLATRRYHDLVKALELQQNTPLLDALKSGRLSVDEVQTLLYPPHQQEHQPKGGSPQEEDTENSLFSEYMLYDDVLHIGNVEPWRETHDVFSELHLSKSVKRHLGPPTSVANNSEGKSVASTVLKDGKQDARTSLKRVDGGLNREKRASLTDEKGQQNLSNLNKRRESDVTDSSTSLKNAAPTAMASTDENASSAPPQPTCLEKPPTLPPVYPTPPHGKLEVMSLECIIRKGQKSTKNSIVYDPEEEISDTESPTDQTGTESSLRLKKISKAERALRQLECATSLAKPRETREKKRGGGLYNSYQVRRMTVPNGYNMGSSFEEDQAYLDEWRQQRLVATMTMKELKKIFPPLVHHYRRRKESQKRAERYEDAQSKESLINVPHPEIFLNGQGDVVAKETRTSVPDLPRLDNDATMRTSIVGKPHRNPLLPVAVRQRTDDSIRSSKTSLRKSLQQHMQSTHQGYSHPQHESQLMLKNHSSNTVAKSQPTVEELFWSYNQGVNSKLLAAELKKISNQNTAYR